MTTAAKAALLVFAAGCGANLPEPTYWPNSADERVFEAIEAEWSADESLPGVGSVCREKLESLRIAVLSDRAFERTCEGYCAPGQCPGYRSSNTCRWGCAGECYSHRCWGSWPSCWGSTEFLGGSRIPLIVIHESKLEDWGWERTVLHGAMHFYEQCTGIGHSGHREARLWGPGGVERRARSRLGL